MTKGSSISPLSEVGATRHDCYDVLIVGAGISGLSLAYYLTKAGMKTCIIEADARTGGVIFSESIGGALLERGPNSALLKRAIKELILELGLEERLLLPPASAKRRYINRPDLVSTLQSSSDTLSPLIAAPTGLFSAIFSRLLTTKGKISLLSDLICHAYELDDESVYDFCRRHFGDECTVNIISAMLSGIWAADVTKLSARSSMPALWNLDRSSGSLLLGAMRNALFARKSARTHKGARHGTATDKPFTHPRTLKQRGIASFPRGLTELTSAIELALPRYCVHLNTKALSIEKNLSVDTGDRTPKWLVKATTDGMSTTIAANCVVLTGDAQSTAQIIDQLDSSLARRLEQIPYSPLGVMQVLVPRIHVKNKLDGFGFLTPPHLSSGLLGAIFTSSMFTNRVENPELHLLTCFVGGAAHPEQSDVTTPALNVSAISELARTIGISGEPSSIDARYFPRAIPSYNLGHYKLIQKIEALEEAHSGLHILTNWRKGISVSDRIEEATTLSKHIVDYAKQQKFATRSIESIDRATTYL